MNQQEGYADDVVKGFITWSLVWGLVAVLLGVVISFQLAFPQLNLPPYLTYGRLRPIHTNAGIFGWGIGSFMAFFIYITQRLTRTRLWSPGLARFQLCLFNVVIALAAVTLMLGMTRSKEYAELEWPVALLVVVLWVIFSVNIVMTIIKRKEEQMYISLWYILACLVGVAVLYLVNNVGIPVSLTKSYSAFAGANDANVQWWYGHNAVAMVLTAPPLALFYYFLPKSTGVPIYSHRMGVIAFWSLIFMYLWTGAHHLLWTPVPDWVQTLAMAFSIMLIAPSWAAVFNGYFSMKGQWHQMRDNYLVKFLIFGITFYGLQTLQGPSQAVRTFSGFIHYTDWVPGHVHMGTLGVGFPGDICRYLLHRPEAVRPRNLQRPPGQPPFLAGRGGPADLLHHACGLPACSRRPCSMPPTRTAASTTASWKRWWNCIPTGTAGHWAGSSTW